MENIFPFILTIIAGFSTLIGFLFVFCKGKAENITKYALAFSSGVMICISITSLIPEATHLLLNNNKVGEAFINTFIFIVLGMLISSIINKIVPENKLVYDKKLYKLGIFSMLAIIMHNIPEGIATFLSSKADIALGISLTIAIALHNIPEGISISIPVYNATKNRKKAFIYTLISALAEPFGGLIAFIFLKPFITDNIMGYTLAIVAGIMIYISVFELLPNALKYKKRKKTWLFFIIGVLFMYLSHLLMG